MKKDSKLIKKKSIGIQTETIPRDFMSAKVLSFFSLESETFPKFLIKTHSLAILSFLCMYIFYKSCIDLDSTKNDFRNNVRNGFFFSCISLIAFGMLFFKDSFFQRPHPSFWRIVQAISICYLFCLIFLLFQSRESVLYFLRNFVDEKLIDYLPEKSYADDCRLWTPENYLKGLHNFTDKLDVFILAHVLGWWGKMLIVRDLRLTMLLSLIFEFLEITFRHWLPNFWECWWDHKKTIIKSSKSSSVIKDTASLFWINHLDKFNWPIFNSTKHFYYVLWYIAFVNLVDLSNFFNKFILFIPPSHPIMQGRVYLWGLLAVISTREYYEYISDEVGASCWIGHFIIFIEYCILFKFSEGFFKEPFPQYVINMWIGIFILLGIATVYLLYKDFKNFFIKSKKEQNINFEEEF